MGKTCQQLVPIDVQLRLVLFGIECALGTPLDGRECDRVFTDSKEDQVSEKSYVFHSSPKITVTGQVDHYEPEMIWIKIEGKFSDVEILQKIVDAAEIHARKLYNDFEK